MKELFKRHSILIVIGSGGVGKTTIAAALGVAAARAHLRTALITIDPARRLREALGLSRLGRKPARIDARRLRAAGVDTALGLSAMVLDVKSEWDRMVAEHVRDPAVRRRILDNAFYQRMSTQFAGSDAYAALEALHNLHASGDYDFEVVDTPPATHAFDFMQAPERLMRVLDSRAARWLAGSAGRPLAIALRLAGHATRYVARELERYAGGDTLSSLADFFAAATGATKEIAARMQKVSVLLRSPAVRFVIVTTAEPDRLLETRKLIERMRSEGLHLRAIVINRLLDETIWMGPVNPRDDGKMSSRRSRMRMLDPALDQIADLKAALNQSGSEDQGVTAALGYLEHYRACAEGRIRRVKSFLDSLPEGVKVALVPEIRPGTPSLASLGRLAQYLVAAPEIMEQPKRRADNLKTQKKARMRGIIQRGVGRMPE